MDGQIPSPPTTATWSRPRCLAGNPSTRIASSRGGKASKALRIAIWLATKILSSLISSTEASPTAQTPIFPPVRSR